MAGARPGLRGRQGKREVFYSPLGLEATMAYTAVPLSKPWDSRMGCSRVTQTAGQAQTSPEGTEVPNRRPGCSRTLLPLVPD